MPSSRAAAVKLKCLPAHSKTMRLPADGSSLRRFSIRTAYQVDQNFPASQQQAFALALPVPIWRPTMDDAAEIVKAEPARRERGGGRVARRELRSHGSQG